MPMRRLVILRINAGKGRETFCFCLTLKRTDELPETGSGKNCLPGGEDDRE
jgi:hypothetical protein